MSNQPNPGTRNINFHGDIHGTAYQENGDSYYTKAEKQSLADAAAEIQSLPKQLEATNPSATEAEQKAFVNAGIPVSLKQRAVSSLKAGGRAAIEEFLDNPYVNVGMAIVDGWISAEA